MTGISPDLQYAPAEATPTWSVNVPGQAVFAVGHLHHFGVLVEATNVTTGQTLCTSTPTYTILHDEPHLTAMSSCIGELGTLSTGDVVRLRSVYEVPAPADDVMGIMLVYVAR